MGVGCGGDDDTTGGTGGSGGSGGSTGGGAGKAGSGGSTGGASGSGGTGGTTDGGGGKAGSDGGADADASTTIMCGTATCGAIVTNNGMLGTLPPCCPTADVPNACGGQMPVALGGACLTKTPGTTDAVCPPVAIIPTVSLPGCCRPDKTCGVDMALAMLGCSSPTAFGQPAGGPCGGDAAPPVDVRPDTADGTTGDGTTGDGTTGDGTTGDGTTGDGTTGDGTTTDAPADGTADSAG
jgi:hypothetical protein